MTIVIRITEKGNPDKILFELPQHAIDVVAYEDGCNCSDGPYHYQSCPLWKPNQFVNITTNEKSTNPTVKT